jgi:hypothetical protein
MASARLALGPFLFSTKPTPQSCSGEQPGSGVDLLNVDAALNRLDRIGYLEDDPSRGFFRVGERAIGGVLHAASSLRPASVAATKRAGSP